MTRTLWIAPVLLAAVLLAAVLLVAALLALPSAARADEPVTCDSGEGDREAAPGHYEGEGSFSLMGEGDFGDLQMRQFNLQMTMSIRAEVAPEPVPGVSGEATGDVTVSISGAGIGITPVATGRTARSEQRTGTFTGSLSKGAIVHVSGADLELALRVERVTCGHVYGSTDMTQGSIAQVAAMRARGGIRDTRNSGLWHVQLAGRDTALEARATAAVQQMDGADASSSGAATLVTAMLAFARELQTSSNPFAKCLSREVLDAVANLLGRRASASVKAITPATPAAALPGLLRRAWQDLRAASAMGCDLGNAGLDALTAAALRRAASEAAGGARGRDLLNRLRNAQATGSEQDIGSFMSDMNAAATAAGHPPPFGASGQGPGAGPPSGS